MDSLPEAVWCLKKLHVVEHHYVTVLPPTLNVKKIHKVNLCDTTIIYSSLGPIKSVGYDFVVKANDGYIFKALTIVFLTFIINSSTSEYWFDKHFNRFKLYNAHVETFRKKYITG
ncbi:unnamed protein product [Sphenostylis stenocarpa]|uniref:Uncharacterized protein n=1 Tax=Sphenostylis stenocarpa TaxID=92480 RepID=A0AA86S4L1_9FABA|nr:unnamed protein product [Sphenostylis stenocarpa]